MHKYVIIDMDMPDSPTAKIWAIELTEPLSVSYGNPDVSSVISDNALHTYRTGRAFIDATEIKTIYKKICTSKKEVDAIKDVVNTMKEIGNED